MLQWAPVFHFYQPPTQNPNITLQVLNSSYIPFLKRLQEHPDLKITANLAGSLVLQLYQLNQQYFFDIMKELVESNQIEFINSPLYHPLIPKHDIHESLRQLEYNCDVIEYHFKTPLLSCIFPPELAVDQQSIEGLAPTTNAVLVDGSCLSHTPSIYELPPSTMYNFNDLLLLISSRAVTDAIRSFPRVLSSYKFVTWISQHQSHNSKIVSINDIEVFGHHYEERLDFLYDVHDDDRIEIVPLSTFMTNPHESDIPKVSKILPSSWALSSAVAINSNPFALWKNPDNPIQSLYWDLIELAHTHLHSSPKPEVDYELRYSSAQKHFDRGISSCHQYWLSNWPWWNPEIPQEGARELISCIRGLPIDNNKKIEAEDLYLEFIKQLWRYHWSGKPEEKYQEYEQFLRNYQQGLPDLEE